MPTLEVVEQGRTEGDLKRNRFKCRTYEKDFESFGSFLYNQLPTEIKRMKSFGRFKRECRKILLAKTDVLLKPEQWKIHKI